MGSDSDLLTLRVRQPKSLGVTPATSQNGNPDGMGNANTQAHYDKESVRPTARGHRKDTDAECGPMLVSLADVETSEVDWLWEGRIPLGTISLLVGDQKVSPRR